MFNQIVLLCRPGFEKECAGEIIAQTNRLSVPTYIQTNEQCGYVLLISSCDADMLDIFSKIDFRQLVFTRQWFASDKSLIELPASNRLAVLLDIIRAFEHPFIDSELSYPDTNDGKALSKFCKKFQPHLQAGLNKHQLVSPQADYRLHLFFLDSQHVYCGLSPWKNSAAVSMGIPRLRMPSSAPSRSTLKLEEAIHWFLSSEQQSTLIHSGMTAVDLGAAPGGWTWQLVKRDCLVTAIDNGPMNDALMRSGMVEHLQTDAFTYAPEQTVDWLVCDMAERPLHVSRLIARWFTEQHCHNAIFNLKLPMKKRLASVEECIDLLHETLDQAGIAHQLQAKQLYHDREEITVCILRS